MRPFLFAASYGKTPREHDKDQEQQQRELFGSERAIWFDRHCLPARIPTSSDVLLGNCGGGYTSRILCWPTQVLRNASTEVQRRNTHSNEDMSHILRSTLKSNSVNTSKTSMIMFHKEQFTTMCTSGIVCSLCTHENSVRIECSHTIIKPIRHHQLARGALRRMIHTAPPTKNVDSMPLAQRLDRVAKMLHIYEPSETDLSKTLISYCSDENMTLLYITHYMQAWQKLQGQ